MIRIWKRLTIRRRANQLGVRIIAGRFPSMWSNDENRTLVRLNRICEGLPPFKSSSGFRQVGDVPEFPFSLEKFGNIVKKIEARNGIS